LKPLEVFGVLLGVFGIFFLDVGFSGSSMTDLFYLGPRIAGVVVPVPPNLGANLLGSLLSVGSGTVFLIGAVFLGVGMMVLVLYNRNSGKFAIGAVPSK
jgi:hypothetical protein